MHSLFDDHQDFADVAARAPTPDQPWWQDVAGRRSTFAVERAGVESDRRAAVEAAHLRAIGTIARAALEARRDEDDALARRYAHGGARLCEELGGLWGSPQMLEQR